MPDSCCAPGCTITNRRIPGSLVFIEYLLVIRRKKKRRLKWLNVIHRDKWSEEEIRNAQLCSAHFISGMRF